MRSYDAAWIKSVITHPKIWPHVADDHAPKPEDFQPIMHDGLYYLAPEHDGQPIGVFFYHPHTRSVYEVHTCVLPEFWGDAAWTGAKAGLRWMVGNTSCVKVVTQVPHDNPRARRFALRVGLRDEGTNRASFLKDGDLLDQWTLGITKDEILCL
jgi:RimJ/RimL family protein N-acetyltransferase